MDLSRDLKACAEDARRLELRIRELELLVRHLKKLCADKAQVGTVDVRTLELMLANVEVK